MKQRKPLSAKAKARKFKFQNQVGVQKTPTRIQKKRTEEVKTNAQTLRKRGNFKLLSAEGLAPTQCSHGPCLLFGQEENGKTRRFFACAVYRNNPRKCTFKMEINEDGSQLNVTETSNQNGKKKKPQYNLIKKKLRTITADKEIVWCKECNMIFEGQHDHPDCEFVSRKALKFPSKFLPTLNDPKGEAQFFFSGESVAVLKQVILNSKAEGILFIGCPTLMEAFKMMSRSDKRFFFLDVDKRYAPFYKSTEFAQYSLLTHHFYDSSSKMKCQAFLQDVSSLLLVCDPPFGVLVEPMLASIKQIRKDFADVNPQGDSFCMLVLPIYVGKRLLFELPDFQVNDYRVTYLNHRGFAKQDKTSVRLFTNFDPQLDLNEVAGYKYCEFCEKWVHESNKHCFMCMKCTWANGPYKHCDRCMRCSKINYKHCTPCERCHLPGRCNKASHEDNVEDEDEEE